MPILSFKEFSTVFQLDEELNQSQKEYADYYSSKRTGPVHRAHDEIFGQNNDRLVIPYDASNDEKITTENHTRHSDYGTPTHAVLSNLSRHGYHTADYECGMVSHVDAPEKKVKISKALEETGLANENSGLLSSGKVKKPMTISQAYAADPVRAAKGEKQIVLTRHPHDIAGMSTGRGWESCMTLPKQTLTPDHPDFNEHHNISHDDDAGQNSNYVKNELANGTLSAYVTRKGDDTIEKPIGRINLKRFDNANGHMIFRPEARKYGTMSPKIANAISDIAEEKSPSKPGIYTKASGSYDDDGKSFKIEKPNQIDYSNKGHHDIDDQIGHSIRQKIDDSIEHANNSDEYFDEENYIDGLHHHANNLYDALPHDAQESLAVHHAINRLGASPDGVGRYANSLHDLHHNNIKQTWAHEHLSSIHEDHMNDITAGKHIDDLMHEHAKIHDNLTELPHIDDDAFDTHSGIAKYHGAIIKSILSRGSEEQKNTVVHDIVHNDTHDWYTNAGINEHPASYTTNPRTIHSLVASSELGSKNIEDSTFHHIGKHTDMKLAEHMWNRNGIHDMVGGNHYGYGSDEHLTNRARESFVRGLNENPHGESIQHGLTHGMLLTGGHNDEQNSMLPNQYEYKHNAAMNWVDGHNSEDDTTKYATIMKHTVHKSVFDKLKNRHDTKAVPEMKEASTQNNLHESVQPKRIKAFLEEYAVTEAKKKESKRSVTGDYIKGMDRKKKKEAGISLKPSKNKTEIILEPKEDDLMVAAPKEDPDTPVKV